MEEELGKEMGERTEKAKEQGIFGGENPRNWQSRNEAMTSLHASCNSKQRKLSKTYELSLSFFPRVLKTLYHVSEDIA
ncbi:hypothetical protein PRIPAC_91013 [Pristionchus pacificus]|nr:hypothetical protein PRIPAC_91013 [Pristionchus pacificus]|eukprot:PDM60504.1 hypothetical protein PRIPAC_53482 [Pristionchus pacificus]